MLPPAAGTAPLRVDAVIAGTAAAAHADVAVNVRDTRWSVLFYDPRPSYMSTFVRRAVERDRRFLVTSRVVTSKNVSTDAGQPPSRLDDLDATSHFDAVVLGAPEALTTSDVSGLEAYLRRRGGSVVLLFDEHVPGPYERLVDAPTWATKSLGAGIAIARVTTDSAALRAAEVAWPTVLPLGAEIVARALATSGDSARNHAVIWQTPVGAGRLVVSGALDAWRFRDPTQSDFDRFWQAEIADAASLSPPPLAVSAAAPVLAPGEQTEIMVTVRRAALAGDLSANPKFPFRRGHRVGVGDRDGQRRHRATDATAPLACGLGRPVSHDVHRSVDRGDLSHRRIGRGCDGGDAGHRRGRRHPGPPDTRDLFAMWIAARGGRVVDDGNPRALTAGLLGALHPAPRAEIRHPMRSAWWIIPFALALCGEWWLRRRRGLPDHSRNRQHPAAPPRIVLDILPPEFYLCRLMYTREEVKAVVDKVINMAKSDSVEVNLTGGERSGTRWANSSITTNLVQYDRQVTATIRIGQKSGSANTRDFSDAGLQAMVTEATENAQKANDNPNLPALLGAQEYIPVDAALPDMVNYGPAQRARMVKDSIDMAEKKGVLGAGYIPKSDVTTCQANSKGLFAYYRAAETGFILTCRMPDGSGSGWSGTTGIKDIHTIDAKALTEVAANKALKSRKAKAIEPGRYTVILEPRANARFLSLMTGIFNPGGFGGGGGGGGGAPAERVVPGCRRSS